MRRKAFKYYLLFVLLWITDTLSAKEIEQWLFSGFYSLKLPLFAEKKDVKGKIFEYKNMLDYSFFQNLNLPEEGKSITDLSTKKWTVTTLQSLMKKPLWKGQNGFFVLTCYLENVRWAKAKIKITSTRSISLKMAGKEAEKKNSSGNEITLDYPFTLERGKHLLSLKILLSAKDTALPQLKISLVPDSLGREEDWQTSLSPMKSMDITTLLNGLRLEGVTLSPQGDYMLVSYSQTREPNGDKETWRELRRVDNNRTEYRFPSGEDPSWLPERGELSLVRDRKEYKEVLLFNPDTKRYRSVARIEQKAEKIQWSPQEDKFLYSVYETPEDNPPSIKRFRELPDRVSGWRKRNKIYLHDLAQGISLPLTHGNLATRIAAFHPSGRKVILQQSTTDYTKPRFQRTLFRELDLNTYQSELLWVSYHRISSVSYSPDGENLLFNGSPMAFGKVGLAIDHKKIANDYDGQLFLWNMKTKKVVSITHDFDPSVSSVVWSKQDNNIYLMCTDKDYIRLYRYDVKAQKYTLLDTGEEVVTSFSLSKKTPVMLCTGTSMQHPNRLWKIELATGKSTLIEDTEKEQLKHLRFGKVEEFTFTNKEETTIDGRLYYPPDFDPSKKYPMIVYYYGGTFPTHRGFRGRYPKNLFAAQGYMVYIVQPTGAIGYGQKFSAGHVNAWGKITADDIIQGTKKILRKHSFIDREKVGCIGASYGGFMTMYLTTQTQIFSAAIAHAGISLLASYWGEGNWGYAYNSIAAAGSYPWTDPQMYATQSPLFQADKIKTPLLLLHGKTDDNVPPGESRQLFTALKILGRPVELIEIEKQGHHILDYKKRILWQKTILAWFDLHLKGEEGFWKELYPDGNL